MRRGKKALDALGKVMSKVSRGKRLTAKERKILAAAIDAVQRAIAEYGKKAKRKRWKR